MPSRRILSNSKLAPIQKNAVNPFDSFNSDTVNLLTRIVSGGSDIIVKGLDVISNKVTNYTNTTNLIKPFSTEEEFQNGWISKNVLWNANGLNFILPSGETYGLSYVECKLLSENCEYLFSGKSDTVRDFNISFELVHGAPKSIVVCINESNFVIDHPVASINDGNGTRYEIKISRNLINDNIQKGLIFRLGVVFDSADPYTYSIPSVTNENGSFKTFSIIKNVFCNIVENSVTSIHNIIQSNDGVYADNGIHMTNTLKVTPGIAIKDDVMLQTFAKTYVDKNATVTLEVDDDYSWIKGKAYTKNDFSGQQYAYQMNGIDSSQSIKKICFFDNDGYLKVKLNDSVNTGLIDDYQFNPEIDTLLNLDEYSGEKDNNGNYIFRSNSKQNAGQFGGRNVLFVYNDGKDYVIGRIQASVIQNEIDPFYVSLNPSLLPATFNQKVDNGTISQHLKAYLTAGPIKVSGDPQKYNKECVKWAYVVLYYAYFKNPKPNISYIGLIDEKDLKDLKYREDYLVLAKLRFIDCHTVDIISYDERQINSLPDASSINYRDTCQYPEIWNGDVPGSITDAINTVVQKLDEQSNTSNLKHDSYKEMDSSYRISKSNSDSNIQKTPIVTINDNNHLERRIRSDSISCVITNINDYSEIVGNINIGDIFILDSKLKLYINDAKTWAFDSQFKSFGPYDSSIGTFAKKYVCFNEIPPYQFLNKINGNKVISVDFKYDDYPYLYPTAPSLKKKNDVFVDTDDGTKPDNYILSYNPLSNLISTDIFKDIVFDNVGSSDTLSLVLKTMGATVNGNVSNSSASNILSKYAFTVGTTEQDNIAIEKLGLLFGAAVNNKLSNDTISDILGDYAFELPENNEILLKLVIVKLGGQYTFTTIEDKYNYLSILANLSIDNSAYSVFDILTEQSEKIHLIKDIILRFGGYITEKDSNDVYITHRGDQIISNILSDITYKVSDNPDEIIDVIIKRVSYWYYHIDQNKLFSDMNSDKNHFSYLKYNGELLTGKKLINELEKNAINHPNSVTADNIVSFGNSDGKLSDSNIQASTIITRSSNINDSRQGYIPEFLSVDAINNTRVIASSDISVDQVKNTIQKLEIGATTRNNLIVFGDNEGKPKDSGITIKQIPFSEDNAIEDQLIKFGNQNSNGQRKLNNSSISENKLASQLDKIPINSTKNNVAIFSDTNGTIVDSYISIKDFMYQPDFIHKTMNEGFDGNPSMETINGDLIGDKGWSGRHYFKNTINGVAFSSKWADLAEYYKVPAGIVYPVGTLVKFGNKYYNDSDTEIIDDNAEIVICNAGDECNAVISSSGNNGTAALILNDKESSGSQLIALSGRVKIRVRGTIKKFEYLTLSDTYKGVAVAVSNNNTQKVIGRALEAHNPSDPNGEGLILCVSTFSLTGNKQNHKPNKNITVNDIAMFQDENGTIVNSGISKQSIILRKRSGEVDSIEPDDGYDTTKNYIPEFAEVNSDGNRLIKNSGIETNKLVKLVNAIPETTDVNNIAIFADSNGKIKDSGTNISNIASVSNSNTIQENTIVKFGTIDSNGTRKISSVKYKNDDLTENILSDLISKIPQQTTPGALVIFDDINGKLGDSHILFNDIDLNRREMITRATNEGFNGDPDINNINSDPVTGGLTGDKGWAGNHYFKNTINGTVLKTQYGDLAEWYTTDLSEGSEYALGTLIKFGGTNEITIASDGEVNGVISSTSQAGLQMGVNYKTNTSQLVALEGKIKIRVIGSVNKFDYLTLSSIPGIAIATSDCKNKKIIARALETNDDIREKMVICVTKFDL